MKDIAEAAPKSGRSGVETRRKNLNRKRLEALGFRNGEGVAFAIVDARYYSHRFYNASRHGIALKKAVEQEEAIRRRKDAGASYGVYYRRPDTKGAFRLGVPIAMTADEAAVKASMIEAVEVKATDFIGDDGRCTEESIAEAALGVWCRVGEWVEEQRQRELASKLETNPELLVGTEGGKFGPLAVTVERMVLGGGYYGPTFGYIMKDVATGAKLAWWASKRSNALDEAISTGKVVGVAGIVKAHKKDPKWGPSTVVRNVKVSEVENTTSSTVAPNEFGVTMDDLL